MLVITRKNSYFIEDNDLSMIELGSIVFKPEENKVYMVLESGVLTELGVEVINADTLDALAEAIATGGIVNITKDIEALTGLNIIKDTHVKLNGNTISIPEDTEGNGVFMVTDGVLTLSGDGIINGLGKNDWSMAVWATDNGKVIINGGYYTNVGAFSENDGQHFDLIYASGNGQIEINGGEFKCETPAWTLNIKDKDRTTASIVVKGGKFHGFNPSNSIAEGEGTNFVAPGYKVIEEESGVFIVIPE